MWSLAIFKDMEDIVDLINEFARNKTTKLCFYIRSISPVKNIHFKINFQETTVVTFDTPRIGQVLDNLLTNAIKFSPVGGTIEITMESGKGCVRVTVTDEGPSIKNEDLDNLFQPFNKFGSDPTKKGTGLGLAIAKKMVKLHGGALTFKPSKNQGASFSFELPENSPFL